MARSVKLYRGGSNNRYYTAAGKADYLAYEDSSASFTEVDATEYTVTAYAIDSASCTLWYDPGGTGAVNAFTGTRDGKSYRYREDDNATNTLTYNVYKVNGSWVNVWGSHPAHVGFCKMWTNAAGCVKVVSANAARYAFVGGLTVRGDDTASVAPNLTSGSSAASGSIVYNNTDGLLWLHPSVAADKSFYVYCGWRWWYCMQASSTTVPDIAPSTRTVPAGKYGYYIYDLGDYIGGGSSYSTVASTSSDRDVFGWTGSLFQGLGQFLHGSNYRILRRWTGTVGGVPSVLRGAKYGPSGQQQFSVGDDIADILTRRPSLSKYDVRADLYPVFATRHTVTVNGNGGTGAAAFYYCPEEGRFFSDEAMDSEIAALAPYTKESSQFIGLYTESSGGTKCVNADGSFVAGWTPAGDCTLYAQWRIVVSVTLDAGEGSGGDAEIWYDSLVGGFVRPNTEVTVDSVAVPRRVCFAFGGYYTAANGGGTKRVNADGTFVAGWTPAEATTLYAKWDRVSWKMTLSPNGGTGEGAIYCNGVAATFYSDDQLTKATDSVEVPAKAGYDFLGYYTAASGGDQSIDADCDLSALAAFASDGTLYAQWSARTYDVDLDYGGGYGTVETKTVTFGQPVGTLPAVTPPPGGYEFLGWTFFGTEVTAATVWEWDVSNPRLVARYSGAFGDVTDYFGLGSGALVPVASDGGEDKPRIVAMTYGKSNGADATSPVKWRNPSVTYMVVRDTTLTVALGRAYAAEFGYTGYMITTMRIDTSMRAFPTVTVSAVANEGEAAINIFAVQDGIPVQARARAQDLLDMVSGGGELQTLSLTLTCDPVVLQENMRPCASDIVNGRIDVEAETLSTSPTDGEPTALNGHAQRIGGGTDYTRWRISARKDL